MGTVLDLAAARDRREAALAAAMARHPSARRLPAAEPEVEAER